MSLLLEALKKAEKAKEEAQRRARGEGGPAHADAARGAGAAETAAVPPAAAAESGSFRSRPTLALESEAPAAEAPRRVVTRNELPDLSAPLEIESPDMTPAAPSRPREELRLESAKEPPRRATAAAPANESAAPQAAERATARKVFEAKFREPNPKLPFYISLAVLSVFAVGTVVYFWYQLRSPYPLVNSNPPRSSEVAVAPAQERPVVAAAPAAPAATSIPGLPAAPSAPQVMQAPASRPAAPPAERPLLSPPPRLAPPSVNAPPTAAAPAAPRPGLEVNVSRVLPQVQPKVEAGYAAYQAGDLAKARAEYEQALADDPGNRDALLGLAAVDTRTGRYESAEANYLRLLQVDPRDGNAQAGLLSLRSARLDPLASESKVKSMLAQDPGAHVLNFTLGNQLAQQGRWAEAQQEYFKAYAGDPENADFAYNLAISLDHLRKPQLARDYYLRAAALAEKRGATFDPAAARARAGQLAN